MNRSILIAAFLTASSAFFLGCPIQGDLRCLPTSISELPNELEVHERSLLMGSEFEIKALNDRIGTVRKKTLSFGTTYTMGDNDDHYLAKATARVFSWGATIEVKDCKGNPIGTIKENILKSALNPLGTVYTILDPQGKALATSEKSGIFKTRFELSDNEGKPIASISRSAIPLLPDDWSVSISNPDVVDARLILMIPVFKTDADNSKSDSSDDDK